MCHGHRYEPERTWTEDDRHIRASDAEREQVVEALRTHAQAGRLTSDELEERVDLALHATTRADLDALHRDLPRARPPMRRSAPSRGGLPPFVPIALLLIAIWAVSGAGYFWPVWPIVWFAFIMLRRAGHTRVTGNTHITE